MSRAVELMVAHVESLKRRHDKNVTELEETKKIVQQQGNSRSHNHRMSPGFFNFSFFYTISPAQQLCTTFY